MNVQELKEGYILIATSSKNWLIKGNEYVISQMGDTVLELNKGFFIPLKDIAENFVLKIKS